MAVDEKQLTEDILRLAATEVSRCMQCGRCSANCEAASKMDLLPNRVVWDLNSGYASELLEADAPWQCLSCMACEERATRRESGARYGGVAPAADSSAGQQQAACRKCGALSERYAAAAFGCSL